MAEMPEVYGWIDRAYVSLEEAGSPVKAFAAAEGETGPGLPWNIPTTTPGRHGTYL